MGAELWAFVRQGEPWPSWFRSRFLYRKEKVNGKADIVFVLVPVLAASVVLVLVVGIELHVPSDREKASNVFRSGAPFCVLTLVIGLERYIGY